MGTVVVPGYIVAAETMKLRADCREMGKKVDPRQTGKPASICNAYIATPSRLWVLPGNLPPPRRYYDETPESG